MYVIVIRSRKKLVLVFSIVLGVLFLFRSEYYSLQGATRNKYLERELDRCIHQQGPDPGGRFGEKDVVSRFVCPPGGYPAGLCSVGPLYLNHTAKKFVARGRDALIAEKLTQALNLHVEWPITVTHSPWPSCTHYYDEAFIFSMDQSPPDELYFDLHVNTFLPLFSFLSIRNHFGPSPKMGYTIALIPAVQMYALQSIDWETDEFSKENRFGAYQQMTQAFSGSMKVQPLSNEALKERGNTCIRSAHFGVGSVNLTDGVLLQMFADFMFTRLGLLRPQDTPTEPCVCLVKRSLTRRILNEGELIGAVEKFVKIKVVQFDVLSYQEQVAQVQQFTILVGVHGSELLNAIYMPEGSVSVQLIPYDVQGLSTKRYAEILRANGPYLEWENYHEANSRPNQLSDKNNQQSDTIIDIEEFVSLVTQALQMGINKNLVHMQRPNTYSNQQ